MKLMRAFIFIRLLVLRAVGHVPFSVKSVYSDTDVLIETGAGTYIGGGHAEIAQTVRLARLDDRVTHPDDDTEIVAAVAALEKDAPPYIGRVEIPSVGGNQHYRRSKAVKV